MSERTQVDASARALVSAGCLDVVDPGQDPVFTRGEWLLRAAADEAAAQKAWLRTGVAVLNCGRLFSAVRINAEVVWAAAETQDLAETDTFLSGALCGGPVFADVRLFYYYALVYPDTAAQHDWVPKRRTLSLRSDARLLADGSYVGVPIPERIIPDASFPYWSVPVGDAGSLCSPHAVLQLLSRGRYALAQHGRLS